MKTDKIDTSMKMLLSQSQKEYKNNFLGISQTGFTLIELMVVIVIVAIFAAIAIPSYRQYVIRNAESETKAQMQQLQIQLDSWRASALSYKGFYPKNVDSTGNQIYKYDDRNHKELRVPLGSGNDYRYKIILVGGDGDKSLATDSVGSSWKMIATPNPSGIASSGYIFKMDSTGKKCQTKDSTIDISSNGCGTNSEVW